MRYEAWIDFVESGLVKKEFENKEAARRWIEEQKNKTHERWLSSGYWPILKEGEKL